MQLTAKTMGDVTRVVAEDEHFKMWATLKHVMRMGDKNDHMCSFLTIPMSNGRKDMADYATIICLCFIEQDLRDQAEDNSGHLYIRDGYSGKEAVSQLMIETIKHLSARESEA